MSQPSPQLKPLQSLVEEVEAGFVRELDRYHERAAAMLAVAAHVERHWQDSSVAAGAPALSARGGAVREQIDELSALAEKSSLGQQTYYSHFSEILARLKNAGYQGPPSALLIDVARTYVPTAWPLRLMGVHLGSSEEDLGHWISWETTLCERVIENCCLRYLGLYFRENWELARADAKSPNCVLLLVPPGGNSDELPWPGWYLIVDFSAESTWVH